MDRVREWLRRIHYFLHRRRHEDALRREMEAHREQMGKPAAFGNVLRLREEARDVWGWNWLFEALRDIRLGARSLRRSPGYTMTAVVILILGIGINLAFFQIVNVTMIRPLEIKDPHTLAYFHHQSRTSDSSAVPYPLAMFVREHSPVLSAVLVSRSTTVAWGDNADERVTGAFVSANWFDELGGAAAVGRVLHEDVDAPGAPAVVVLSHAFWQRRLGGATDIANRTVRINGRPVIVAGVAASAFPDLHRTGADVWLPIEQVEFFQPDSRLRSSWSERVNLYGRFRQGVTPGAAKASLQATLAASASSRPKEAATPGDWLEPYLGSQRFQNPRERREAWTLAAGVAALAVLVLAITCLNLGNLALARAVARIRELSIRTALGAGRWRVMRLLLVENGLVAAAGAAGGLVLGVATAAVFASTTGEPASLSVATDWRTVLAATGAALSSMVVVSFAPVWKIGRRDLALATRDGGARASQGLQTARLRQWLVAAQIGCSCVLLVFAAQMTRSLHRVQAGNRFDAAQAVVLAPALDAFGVTGSAARAYWDDVRAIVGTHPEADRVTLVSRAPFDGSSISQYNVAPHVKFENLNVEGNFFATLGIPVIAGRTFEPNDTSATAAIISERGAIEMYGTSDVVGERFPKGTAGTPIVGVVRDVRLFRLQATDRAEIYLPLRPAQSHALIVRAKSDPSRLLAPVRQAGRTANARVIPEVRLLTDDFTNALRAPAFASGIAGMAALLALVLACLGIFGVVSYGARLRRREIGIRLALGASRGSIKRLLVRQTLWSACLGMALGLAGGWPAGSVFAGDPFYLQPSDAPAYAAAAALVLIAGSVAALLPAFRTLRADPLQALKHE